MKLNQHYFVDTNPYNEIRQRISEIISHAFSAKLVYCFIKVDLSAFYLRLSLFDLLQLENNNRVTLFHLLIWGSSF